MGSAATQSVPSTGPRHAYLRRLCLPLVLTAAQQLNNIMVCRHPRLLLIAPPMLLLLPLLLLRLQVGYSWLLSLETQLVQLLLDLQAITRTQR